MAQRISDTVLPNNYLQDGDILTAEQLNILVTLLKGGVNQNYEDIKRILDGEVRVGMATFLSDEEPVDAIEGDIWFDTSE